MSRENCDGETSFLNQIVKEDNTLSTLLNGKRRLELEEVRGMEAAYVSKQNKTTESAERAPFRFTKPTKTSVQETC